MHVNLGLLVNEELLRMGQWSRFWQVRRVPVLRDAICYKKLNLLLEWCICPKVLVINFFFHNLTCLRYEDFKDLVSHRQQKKCVAYGTLIF